MTLLSKCYLLVVTAEEEDHKPTFQGKQQTRTKTFQLNCAKAQSRGNSWGMSKKRVFPRGFRQAGEEVSDVETSLSNAD